MVTLFLLTEVHLQDPPWTEKCLLLACPFAGRQWWLAVDMGVLFHQFPSPVKVTHYQKWVRYHCISV